MQNTVLLGTGAISDSITARRGREVLIVEQNQLAAGVLKTKLTAWGYKVRAQARARDGLQEFRAAPARIVFLGADIDGVADLCTSLRQIRTAGYTYVIGVGAGTDDLVRVLEAGADEFIRRPINVQELRLRLRNAERLLSLDDTLFRGGGVDPSTGRVTRGAFETFLRAILAQARRAGSKCALLFVRLPDHQAILDAHGFDIAHKAVVEVSGQLAGVHRDSDVVAKIDDDEFCLLLQDTEWDICRPVVERILERTAGIAVPIGPRESRRLRVVVETINVPVDYDGDVARLLDDHGLRVPSGSNEAA